MDGEFRLRGRVRVRWAETDRQGVVFNRHARFDDVTADWPVRKSVPIPDRPRGAIERFEGTR